MIEMRKLSSTVLLFFGCSIMTAHGAMTGGSESNGMQLQTRLLEMQQGHLSMQARSQLAGMTVLTAMFNEYLNNSISNRTLNTVTYCKAEEKPIFRFGTGSLLTYLMRLKICQVVTEKNWLEDECRDQHYALTDYHKAAYIKFCNPEFFNTQCMSAVDHNPASATYYWINKYDVTTNYDVFRKLNTAMLSSNYFNESQTQTIQSSYCEAIESFFDSILPEGNNMVSGYSSSNLTLELERPLYNIQYAEWFLRYRAFCQPNACGISRQEYDQNPINAFDCFVSACNAPIIVTIFIDALLAVLVVVANFLVLAVAWRSTVMRNIPGYFKISLAIADMIVGLVVLPGSVYNGVVLSAYPLPFRLEGQKPMSTDYFAQSYLDCMGFFTVWSFSVSVFTLGAASIDRFLAITKPFKYKQGKYLTKRRSFVVFFLIWAFGFGISIYPIFTGHSYTLSALGLVLSVGMLAIALYSVALGLPLLAVWVINLAMLGHVCSGKENRRNLSVVRKRNSTADSYKSRKPKQSVTSISSKQFSNQFNDDVFEKDPLENNNKREGNRNHSKPTLYFRGKPGTESQRRNRISQFTSSMHLKLKSRFSQSSIKSLTSPGNVERRLAKTLGVMIGAFTLALLPAVIVLSIQPALMQYMSPQSYPKMYSAETLNIYTSMEYIAARLFLSNSFWNCIIYSVRNHHFRQAVIDVFISSEEKRRRRRSTIATYSSSKMRRDTKTTSIGSSVQD